MRIIAGTHKGRTLTPPSWEGLRPTSDRLRETLFNILAGRVDGAAVLDLCAGTGAVGLEALSRGAARVTFIDNDARALRLIAANAARCGLENRCVIIRGEAPGVLAAAVTGGPFDLVLLDPPYGAPWTCEALAAVARLVAPEGQVILEHAWRVPAPTPVSLQLVGTRRSGDSALSTYRVAADTDGGDTEER